jgi:Flp pilus assembly pilin Flp
MDEFRAEECGQDMVEYALLAALIAVVCIAALQAFSGAITSIWTVITTRLSS